MAGVKTQKSGGKRMESVFIPVPCDSCGQIVVKLSEAYRVRVIDMATPRTHWAWKHRKCLNLAQK
jgi:hypothetical protein